LFWEFYQVEAQLHLNAWTSTRDDDKIAEKHNITISFSQKITTICTGLHGRAIHSNSTYRTRTSYLTKQCKKFISTQIIKSAHIRWKSITETHEKTTRKVMVSTLVFVLACKNLKDLLNKFNIC
jgi:hypothetical protein